MLVSPLGGKGLTTFRHRTTQGRGRLGGQAVQTHVIGIERKGVVQVAFPVPFQMVR